MLDSRIFYHILDNEDYDKLKFSIENTFRKSKEYTMWLNGIERDVCAATGYTKSEDGIRIEVHHYGRTLYDWVSIIVDRFLADDLPLNSLYICMILTSLHFNRCITYVPLMRDIHVMLHNDYEATINKYPTILNHITYGDYELADKIINEYIEVVKKEMKG